MSLFERNLNKYGQSIAIQSRVTSSATFGNSNPEQTFTTIHTIDAIVQTPRMTDVAQSARGEVVFDSIDIENQPTHKFTIAWLTGITQENWILFNSLRYDLMSIINCCERDSTLIMLARLRGAGEAAAA